MKIKKVSDKKTNKETEEVKFSSKSLEKSPKLPIFGLFNISWFIFDRFFDISKKDLPNFLHQKTIPTAIVIKTTVKMIKTTVNNIYFVFL
jgi:hypothetical protein